MIKIDNDVLDVLTKIQVRGSITTMPPLDRKLYEKTNKVLEILGGKWSRKDKCHAWECDPNEPLSNAVTTGEVLDWRQEYQFFETPIKVVDRMVKFLQRVPNRILEPSAGKGAIISGLYYRFGYAIPIDAVELNPTCAAVILNQYCNVHLACMDFLEMPASTPIYDTIAMNPPFRNGGCAKHIQHAWKFLKPGGELVAITDPGWTFRSDRLHREFREWLDGKILTEEDLPSGTFPTTDIRTKLLDLEKQ